jgi:hypothetical protein
MMGIEHLHLLASQASATSGRSKMLTISKGFFRYRVYELGHTIGDNHWVASFRRREDALLFIRAKLQSAPPRNDDPVQLDRDASFDKAH